MLGVFIVPSRQVSFDLLQYVYVPLSYSFHWHPKLPIYSSVKWLPYISDYNEELSVFL